MADGGGDSLMDQFMRSAMEVQGLTQKPPNEELLQLYGLWKVVYFGANNTQQPGMFAGPKERAKWIAWTSVSSLSQSEAMAQYVELVEMLKVTYGWRGW